jgi:hypothetical protein
MNTIVSYQISGKTDELTGEESDGGCSITNVDVM